MGNLTRSGRTLALAAAVLALTSQVAFAAGATTGARVPDPGREGLSHVKWKQLGRVLRPRNTVTLGRLRSFEKLDMGALNARRSQLGQPEITGVLLDVDETLAPHHGPIAPANKQRIRGLLAAGVTVGIYSNASDVVTPQRQADLDELRQAGVLVLGGTIAPKPSTAGFDTAVTELAVHAAARGRKLTRGQIVMFGDNYMTDGGAIQAGLGFVKVKPVATDERKFRHPSKVFLKRTGQRLMRGYATLAWGVHEHLVPGRPRAISADAR